MLVKFQTQSKLIQWKTHLFIVSLLWYFKPYRLKRNQNSSESDLYRIPVGKVNLYSHVFCTATSQMLRLPVVILVYLWQWDKPVSLCHFNFKYIFISQSLPFQFCALSLSFCFFLSLYLSLFVCVCCLYERENYSQQPSATDHSAVRKHSFGTIKQNENEANNKRASWLKLGLGNPL